MERILQINELYEVYGNLLTDKQKQIVEAYYWDDLSLSEVAENSQISRQAISIQLHRAVEKLQHYEDVLQIIKNRKDTQKILSTVIDRLLTIKSSEIEKCIRDLETLLTPEFSD